MNRSYLSPTALDELPGLRRALRALKREVVAASRARAFRASSPRARAFMMAHVTKVRAKKLLEFRPDYLSIRIREINLAGPAVLPEAVRAARPANQVHLFEVAP